jgi:hypothetical protein
MPFIRLESHPPTSVSTNPVTVGLQKLLQLSQYSQSVLMEVAIEVAVQPPTEMGKLVYFYNAGIAHDRAE